MERLPDHPTIRRTERTGYSFVPRALTCDWCDCEISGTDDYYEIHGEILCEECVEDCRKGAAS